jgi:nucleolar MIF4G domain-containing protein 1
MKRLTNHFKYAVLAHEPLRVSLEDLHTADKKGKWWLIGAAWGGDPWVDRQGKITKADENVDTSDRSSNHLLKLARKQGMNTDIRRSIFVVLLSSDVSSLSTAATIVN